MDLFFNLSLRSVDFASSRVKVKIFIPLILEGINLILYSYYIMWNLHRIAQKEPILHS